MQARLHKLVGYLIRIKEAQCLQDCLGLKVELLRSERGSYAVRVLCVDISLSEKMRCTLGVGLDESIQTHACSADVAAHLVDGEWNTHPAFDQFVNCLVVFV